MQRDQFPDPLASSLSPDCRDVLWLCRDAYICATNHPVGLHGGMCLAARSQPLLTTIVTFV
jgi:hypothetical protein